MNKLVILGGGTAGTIMVNKLSKKLHTSEWQITLIEKESNHYYQPGFLFLPFGYYKSSQVIKPVEKFYPSNVTVIKGEAASIDHVNNVILMSDGVKLSYNILIIATGTRIVPEDTPGMTGELWHKRIFDFYTMQGAEALAGFFKTWEGGELVINIADNPIKCPVAPLEFAFYADEFFTKKGIRNKVNVTYVTPMSGAFTKPIASKVFGSLLQEKNINLVTDFFIGEVDNTGSKILDFGGREVKFDCLITIPLHAGDKAISGSGLGDEFGFVRANKNTLQSLVSPNVFVIGDAGNFPASKAGSVAHFQADILEQNISDYIDNKPLSASFDGHSNCYIETGYGKGILIDFNYETEPLTGLYPLPVVGPFRLLKQTRINHYGKLLFKWIYWNILLRARHLPVTNHMSMAGKIKE